MMMCIYIDLKVRGRYVHRHTHTVQYSQQQQQQYLPIQIWIRACDEIYSGKGNTTSSNAAVQQCNAVRAAAGGWSESNLLSSQKILALVLDTT